MHPVLFTIGGVDVKSYAVFVALAFVVAIVVRRIEMKRIATTRAPLDRRGKRIVEVSALVGAVVGSKLGMVLFASPDELKDIFAAIVHFDFAGKTVVGGVAGGWIGVEIGKKLAGITRRTGDVFALSIPLGLAVGRIGCLLNGCCWGTTSDVPWSVFEHDAWRHPTPIYEALLDVTLAIALFATRNRVRAEGRLFRESVIGVCAIRAFVEIFRGDPSWSVGPFSAPQLVCLVAAIAIFVSLVLERKSALASTP